MKKCMCTILATIILAGCASVETTTKFNGMQVNGSPTVAHINAKIWGIYLFPTVPLFYPSEGQINVDTAVNMLTQKARAIGATSVSDVQSDLTSSWIVPSFVLWYKGCEVSGNAYK